MKFAGTFTVRFPEGTPLYVSAAASARGAEAPSARTETRTKKEKLESFCIIIFITDAPSNKIGNTLPDNTDTDCQSCE